MENPPTSEQEPPAPRPHPPPRARTEYQSLETTSTQDIDGVGLVPDVTDDDDGEGDDYVTDDSDYAPNGGATRIIANTAAAATAPVPAVTFRWPPPSKSDLRRVAFDYLLRSPHRLREAVLCATFVGLAKVAPIVLFDVHRRPIPYQTTSAGDVLIDLTFDAPYTGHETVPGWLAAILCVILPLAFFVAVGALLGPDGDVHAILCAYLTGMAVKIFVTDCTKNYAGYFRPDFYDRCGFDDETLACEDGEKTGRKSFPSGHAGTAFASMTMVTLYLLGKVGTQRGLTFPSSVGTNPSCLRPVSPFHPFVAPSLQQKCLAIASLFPMFVATMIAASRVRDNWHHPADVVGGSVIGAASALFAHGLWYPPVYSPFSGVPLQTLQEFFRMETDLDI